MRVAPKSRKRAEAALAMAAVIERNEVRVRVQVKQAMLMVLSGGGVETDYSKVYGARIEEGSLGFRPNWSLKRPVRYRLFYIESGSEAK